jgi:hypothetical protein
VGPVVRPPQSPHLSLHRPVSLAVPRLYLAHRPLRAVHLVVHLVVQRAVAVQVALRLCFHPLAPLNLLVSVRHPQNLVAVLHHPARRAALVVAVQRVLLHHLISQFPLALVLLKALLPLLSPQYLIHQKTCG